MATQPTDLLELVRGCTFDDFLLTPQLGVVASRDPSVIDLTTRFTTQISLKRPIVSANMDTVTRAAMAVALAEEGGIGVIDRGFRAGDRDRRRWDPSTPSPAPEGRSSSSTLPSRLLITVPSR